MQYEFLPTTRISDHIMLFYLGHGKSKISFRVSFAKSFMFIYLCITHNNISLLKMNTVIMYDLFFTYYITSHIIFVDS